MTFSVGSCTKKLKSYAFENKIKFPKKVYCYSDSGLNTTLRLKYVSICTGMVLELLLIVRNLKLLLLYNVTQNIDFKVTSKASIELLNFQINDFGGGWAKTGQIISVLFPWATP